MIGLERPLSLVHLLDPEVLADPYPLYRQLRETAPVYWDPMLHAWVVTRYHDVVHVLHRFSAARTPSPAQLESMGLAALTPIARIMVRQMLFMDPPDHTRLRTLAAFAFTPVVWPCCASTSRTSPTVWSTLSSPQAAWTSSRTSPSRCPPSSPPRCWAYRRATTCA